MYIYVCTYTYEWQVLDIGPFCMEVQCELIVKIKAKTSVSDGCDHAD